MIVASLLLILVAVTLLVLGLAGGSSSLLIGSIVASLLAAVALVIGARQAAAARRATPAGAGLDEAGELADPAPLRHPDVGADPPPPARRDHADLSADPAFTTGSGSAVDQERAAGSGFAADRERAAGSGRAAEQDRADLSGDLRAGSPAGTGRDPSGDLGDGGEDLDAGGAADERGAAYTAGRRDAATHVAGSESTQRVQPDADLYDDAAAGRPSSGQAAGPASPRGDDDRAARATGPRATGGPWSRPDPDEQSGSGAGTTPWVRGPGQATPPEDDPAVPNEPVGARRGSTEPAGLVDDFDEPDPDDPDDEPLPQAVRPADAVRVARLDAEVLVVDGRPRYHLAECPHLVGRLTEGLPVAEAVELGFSPCGLCRPVDRLVAAAAPR